MEAQTLAAILLGLRIVATVLLGSAVIKQIQRARKLKTSYPTLRLGVMVGTMVLLLGQIIPIRLDSVVAFGSTYAGRNLNPNALGVSYALNNAIKDVVIGILLAVMYFRGSKD